MLSGSVTFERVKLDGQILSRQLLDRFGAGVRAAGRQNNPGAAAGQLTRHFEADAAVAARDNDDGCLCAHVDLSSFLTLRLGFFG